MSRLIIFSLMVLSFTSCSRKYIASMFTSDSQQKSELTRNVRLLTKAEKKWQISYGLDVPKEGLNVDGKVRIVRDSIIWMNVKKLGVEAMRIKLTKDSAWILDRLKKKYFAGSYADFEKFAKIPFDFALCQAVFLNEPYLELVTEGNAKVQDSLIVYSSALQKENRSMEITQSYFLDPVFLNGFIFFSESINTKGEIKYEYKKKLKLNGFRLTTSNKNLPEAYFKMKKIENKDKLSIRFKIPKRYEKMHFK